MNMLCYNHNTYYPTCEHINLVLNMLCCNHNTDSWNRTVSILVAFFQNKLPYM
jgi:hypothetical protein